MNECIEECTNHWTYNLSHWMHKLVENAQENMIMDAFTNVSMTVLTLTWICMLLNKYTMNALTEAQMNVYVVLSECTCECTVAQIHALIKHSLMH